MPVLTVKKTDGSRWLHSSRFGRIIYAGYSDLHGKWTAGFCDGYIRASAGSYKDLVDKLGMPVAAHHHASLGMCHQPIWGGHTGKRWDDYSRVVTGDATDRSAIRSVAD